MISISESPSPISPVTLLELLDLVDAAVRQVARRLPAQVSRDDLASAGRLALVKAFAEARGPAEEIRAFCFVRIKGAMLDELRSNDVLSRHDRTLQRAMSVMRREHLQSCGEEPPVELIAARLECSVARLERIQALLSADLDAVDLSQVADSNSVAPDSAAMSSEVVDAVRSLVATLARGQAHAVMRFHLEEATLAEIAEELGVSIERARQLRIAGEKALRQAIVKAWRTDRVD